MEIDETKMREWDEPSLWQKLRNSVFALVFGVFLLMVTPMSFSVVLIPNGTVYYLVLCLYATTCFLLGWFYGDNFTSYLHAKILRWWHPRDMFR